MPDLKPCPFCGGEPEVGHVNEDEFGPSLDDIRCVRCQVGGFRAGWQHRFMPEAVRLVCEEMEACPLPQNWASENVTVCETHVRDWAKRLRGAYNA